MSIHQYEGNDALFLKAWELACVAHNKSGQPTRRQFTKWKQGRGLAHSKRTEAIAVLDEQKLSALRRD